MIDEKKIELMKKLQRLAERGVGGCKGTQTKTLRERKQYIKGLGGITQHCTNRQETASQFRYLKASSGKSY